MLIVDDDPDLLHLLELRLTVAGYAVIRAASGLEAIEQFRRERPQVVITDIRMEGMDGHALFASLHEVSPGIPVIMLTAHGSIPEAVAATQSGVFSFITKPFDGKELLARVAAALMLSPVVSAPGGNEQWRAGFVGQSPLTETLLREAFRLAGHEEPMLLIGMAGTGKQCLAQAIARASSRAKGPFVSMHCAAAVDAGALLNAKSVTRWSAWLRDACGGVLYLDDLAALPPVWQAELAQLVQSAGWPGKTPLREANVRLIAAALPGLERELKEGRVRPDLYYYFAANKLVIPGLAERCDDIPALVAHFLALLDSDRRFSPDAMQLLKEAAWPGGVRQLDTLVAHCAKSSVTPIIPLSLVQRALGESTQRQMGAFDNARRSFERDYLISLLEATHGNVARAARIAERNRSDFYKLLARHELDPLDFKAHGGAAKRDDETQ